MQPHCYETDKYHFLFFYSSVIPLWEKSDFKKTALSCFGQSQIFKKQRFPVLGKAKFSKNSVFPFWAESFFKKTAFFRFGQSHFFKKQVFPFWVKPFLIFEAPQNFF